MEGVIVPASAPFFLLCCPLSIRADVLVFVRHGIVWCLPLNVNV